MVMTEKSMKKQKSTPFYVKEDNPARKHMSYDDAVADNKRLKDEREKVEAYKQKLKDERSTQPEEAAEAPPPPPPVTTPFDNDSRIGKLKIRLSKQKGPGSTGRKAKIQDEIDAIKRGEG